MSGLQFYNISPIFCVVCSPSKVKSLLSRLMSPLSSPTPPQPAFPSDNHHAVVSMSFFPLIPSTFSPSLQPLPSNSCQSVLCLYSLFPFSLYILFVYLFIRFHTKVKTYGVCHSLTGLFHLAYYFPGLSMLSPKVGFSSFSVFTT